MRLLILVLLTLIAIGVCAQTPSMDSKLSPRFKNILHQGKIAERDSMEILVSVTHPDVFEKKFSRVINITQAYKASGSYLIKVAAKDLNTLLESNEVLFADTKRKPKEELTTGAFDISVNQINLVHHHYPVYNGSDILVSIKEQKLDTTDIDFKGRYTNTKVAASKYK